MGLIRKATSVSTLGGVKYTSRREAATKASLAEARLADEQAKQVKKQAQAARKQDRQAQRQETATATDEKWGPVVAAIEAGEASWDDLTRMQKMSMPVGYQLRCKAAMRRRGGES